MVPGAVAEDLNYDVELYTTTTATTASTMYIISSSSDCTSGFYINYGCKTSDGRWFSDSKEAEIWENELYNRSLWGETQGKAITPRSQQLRHPAVSRRQLAGILTAVSRKQKQNQKRKSRLHNMRNR